MAKELVMKNYLKGRKGQQKDPMPWWQLLMKSGQKRKDESKKQGKLCQSLSENRESLILILRGKKITT